MQKLSCIYSLSWMFFSHLNLSLLFPIDSDGDGVTRRRALID